MIGPSTESREHTTPVAAIGRFATVKDSAHSTVIEAGHNWKSAGWLGQVILLQSRHDAIVQASGRGDLHSRRRSIPFTPLTAALSANLTMDEVDPR